MLPVLLLATLPSLPYASPAKAGAQLRAGGNWAPAFAGEAEKDEPGTNSSATDATSMSPIDAERAFAADAKAIGQWTAFRKWSTDDAKMFVPEPVNAQEWLQDRKDPPIAVTWQPTSAWLSCDGWLAATTGNWQRPNAVGYFSTLWSIGDPDRPVWKWRLDHGDNLASARPAVAKPTVRRAACSKPTGNPAWPELPNPDMAGRGTLAGGSSGDQTLRYRWYVSPDGARGFAVALWNGTSYEIVLDDKVQAPPPK